MKLKQAISLCLILFSFVTISAQVGVGTPLPDNSAQLDVLSNNKGVLIPRIPLTSSTDVATIPNPANSLLVFNTNTVTNDITPGYHYWDGTKWQRMTSMDDVVTLIQTNETITNLVDNGDGTITYTNEAGTEQTVDIVDLITQNIINQGDIYNELITVIDANSDVFQDNGDGTFTHTAADGTIVNFDANTTTLLDNNDGSYVLTNANGDSITIDVIADVVNNITNQGDIYNELITVIDANSDVFQDNGDGTFTHTAADGTIVNFDANTTTLLDNNDGSYVLTNANGDSITIDVIADVVNNITNQGDIYNELITVIDANSDVFQDNGDGTFTHTAADGTIVNFDANTTTLLDNNDGSYVLTNANGDSITIDVIADVVNNITNQGDIYNELITVINANSDTLEDNGDGTFTHTAADNAVIDFDITQTGTGDPNTNGTTGAAGAVYVDDANGNVWTNNGTNWVNQNPSSNEPWFGAGPDSILGTADDTGATQNTEDIYSLGRVGVGTSLPLGALHVVSENSDDALFVRSLSGDLTNDMDIDLIRTYGTAILPQVIDQDGTRLGGLRYRGLVGLNPDPLVAIPIFAEISTETDGVPTATSAPGKLIFETTPAGSTIAQPRMTIKNDGNIGIGTTTPNEKLEVNGKVRVSDLTGADAATDLIVTADNATGELKSINASTITTTAAIRTETTSYTIAADDATVLADASGGTITLTLPTPVMGKKYVVKKIDATVNNVVLDGAGATIDGVATRTTNLPYQTFTLQSDGANWFILNQ